MNDAQLNLYCLRLKQLANSTQEMQSNSAKDELKTTIRGIVAHGEAALKRLDELCE